MTADSSHTCITETSDLGLAISSLAAGNSPGCCCRTSKYKSERKTLPYTTHLLRQNLSTTLSLSSYFLSPWISIDLGEECLSSLALRQELCRPKSFFPAMTALQILSCCAQALK